MAEYTKPWLSISEQLDKLESRSVDDSGRQTGARLLSTVGYYRVTGYLFPFRESEPYVDEPGRQKTLIHNNYQVGTTLEYAEALINFDRQLRMLVLDGIERIEVSLRTQLGHVLGRQSAFAHLDPINFVNAFTDPIVLRASLCVRSAARLGLVTALSGKVPIVGSTSEKRDKQSSGRP
ncbi:Abi family protein [Subtercola frigoramans]|uniref:Abortive infection bacteriophage resistance protein n=1 Tax=Subtercola frigoramans TaxID=120298 RepID=A0ABS2L701_9MICO|nr:Abi family protein [Subtercola frigoramans]MBM7472863.1 abortive infection bacteriophage resistance protein [Subtercola frigoramans]